MLDSGSDDGGSIPFGCTRFNLPTVLLGNSHLFYNKLATLNSHFILLSIWTDLSLLFISLSLEVFDNKFLVKFNLAFLHN